MGFRDIRDYSIDELEQAFEDRPSRQGPWTRGEKIGGGIIVTLILAALVIFFWAMHYLK